MIGGVSDHEVVQAIEQWIPSQEYDHERKFQSELQDYLDEALNSSGTLLGGGGGGVEVSTERGMSRADLAINDQIGIEMKRNLSNSQTKKLKGQIDDQREEYESVIVVACGIDDMDGWRRVQNKIQRDSIGLQSPVHFIYKPREKYGSDPSRQNSSGGMFDF
ncbi:hypothetical protein [Halobacterium wangiae]|uniref:hypothetical protein n=1 Tax=Halobacterium wangiae TaxID=2902623 RepID=UPI001E37DBEB|nr:hypothetical protein [Halobacterium wangiae]